MKCFYCPGIPIVTEQFLWDLLEKAKKQRMSAAAATTSPQRAKKRRRQACRYGAQCYNHGKEHRAKYAHVDSVEDTCEGEGGEEQEGKDVTAVDTTAACQVDFAAADDDGSKMEEPDASAASDSDTGSTEAHLDLRDGESRTVEGGSDTYVVEYELSAGMHRALLLLTRLLPRLASQLCREER